MGEGELAAGIDLGGTAIKMGLVDAGGRIVSREAVEIDAAAPYDRIAGQMVRGLSRLAEGAAGRLAAIGLGTPGFIDAETGVIEEGVRNIPALEGRSLVPAFRDETAFRGVPVYADNDATCAAAGELRFGAGRSFRHFVLITLGAGVGGGLVLDGQVYRGARGFAGEIGHMVVQPLGEWCNCGSRGCLERYASGPAILRRYRDRCAKRGVTAPESLTVKEVFELERQGDPLAADTIDEAARAIAQVFGSLTNLLNPQALIVAGGISRAGERLLAPIRRHLPDFTWPRLTKELAVLAGRLQEDAGLIGAAAQALERVERWKARRG